MKKLLPLALACAALATAATSCTPCTERKADYVCTVTQRTSNGVVLETRHTVPLMNVTPRERSQYEKDNSWTRVTDADGNTIVQTTTCE